MWPHLVSCQFVSGCDVFSPVPGVDVTSDSSLVEKSCNDFELLIAFSVFSSTSPGCSKDSQWIWLHAPAASVPCSSTTEGSSRSFWSSAPLWASSPTFKVCVVSETSVELQVMRTSSLFIFSFKRASCSAASAFLRSRVSCSNFLSNSTTWDEKI